MKETRTVIIAIAGLSAGVVIYLWHLKRKSIEKKKQRKLEAAAWVADSTICVISSCEEWNQVVPQIQHDASEVRVLGLDCEWVTRDKVRCPVGLLQLATASRLIVLVRLCHMAWPDLPTSLQALLADRKILKVGVGIGEDARKLAGDFGMPVAGCLDLRHLTSRVKPFQSLRKKSLKNLAEEILGVHFSNSLEIRCSNWNAEKLSQQQVMYAAADAQVGVDIFVKLALTKSLGVPPSSLSLEAAGLTKEDFWKQARSLCQGLVDVPYKEKGLPAPSPKSKEENAGSSMANSRHAPEKDPTRAYSVRKTPLYHGSQLLAPDGQLLCTCDVKKASWYLEKGLADMVKENPLVVKFRFEPSGRPSSGMDYYLQEKENICVVCGAEDSFIRKYIIPQEYRKYFPTLLKEHKSHDVLLMCPPCYSVCSHKMLELRRQLADECDAPLHSGQTHRVLLNHDLNKVKSAAKALLLNRARIPPSRVQCLEQTVLDYYGVSTLTEELLHTAMEIDIRQENKDYYPHGKKVVEQMRKTVGLIEFERRCRQFFVDTMKPKFLPPLWSVDHANGRTHQMCVDMEAGSLGLPAELSLGREGEGASESGVSTTDAARISNASVSSPTVSASI